MKLEEFEGKTKEEALEKALESLGVSEEDIYYRVEEKKGKLFKAATYLVKAIKISDIAEFIKEHLAELVTNMGIDAKYETNVREEHINIKMYSDNNNILIGRNGQTLIAMQNILRQQVYNEIGMYPHVILDVENYKEKKNFHLEKNAKRIAKEVQKTKVDVALDDMNSYERRVVHNAISKFKNISSASEGEEPHRHIVIRYVESEVEEEDE